MIGTLTNHLWQSTLFAILAALLTLAFRTSRAEVRYWLWFSASVKFFIPFSLLLNLGSYLRWLPPHQIVAAPPISVTLLQITEPFPSAVPRAISATGRTVDYVPVLLIAMWLCGFGAIALLRTRDWLSIRAAVRASTPIGIPAVVEVRSSPGLLEPGVVGLFRSILLLPTGIVERLTPRELEAVLAHELCHIARRDNLASACHMIVEAAFWFHPLVWWIGARQVEERERACDEAVLALGSKPHDYAAAILKICQTYFESPLLCVAGVTGSNLKKRIQRILTGQVPSRLSVPRKLILSVAGMAALVLPFVMGVVSAGHMPAQVQPSRAATSSMVAQRFEFATIKPCYAFRNRPVPESAGRLQSGCTTLQRLMQQAYGVYGSSSVNPLSSVTITGGPAWTDSDLYEIDAKASGAEGQVLMKGPMLQALLESRFKLKAHREIRQIPVYDLTVSRGGPNLEPYQGSCVPWDYDHPAPGPQQCATTRRLSDGIKMTGWTMADLSYFLFVTLQRPVIDKTGTAGRFDFRLQWSTEAATDFGRVARGAPARTDHAADMTDALLTSAVMTAVNRLGMNLTPADQPGEYIVIDAAERPSEN